MNFNLFAFDSLRSRFGPEGSVGPAPRAPAPELREIARLDNDAVLAKLETSLDGLLGREAEERLEQFGENSVAHEEHKSALRRLYELFSTPLSLLLLSLAVIAELTGEVRGAIVIFLMVVLSVLMSFVQEYRSSQAAEKLRAMVHTTATVRRKDKRAGVPEEINRAFQVQLRPGGAIAVEVPLAHVGAGRHRAFVGGGHDPGRPARAVSQGPVRQPGLADR
ncbi:MAG: cation-transporting P-type ATPase [Rhodospirillales bacterium]